MDSPPCIMDLPFGCNTVLFRPIERSAPVADCRPLIQIYVALVLKKDSFQCIIRCVCTNNVWSVRLRNDPRRKCINLDFSESKASRVVALDFYKFNLLSFCKLSLDGRAILEKYLMCLLYILHAPHLISFVFCLSKR